MGLLKINYITRLTLAEWLVSIILMKKFFYFLALLFISLSASFQSAHANIVINAVLTDEKNSHDITPTKATNLTYETEEFTLLPAASGLRKRKVFALVNVKFYFAELLAAQPQKLIKTETEILPSMKNSQPVEMKLTLIRDVPHHQIIDYFTEAFKANEITEANYSPAVKQFFEELKNLKQLNKNDIFLWP